MSAPIALSSVFPSWVLLWACLAAGAAAVMVVTVLFAQLTQPPQRARQPQHTAQGPRAEKPSHHALVHGETPAGRSKAARKERLRCQA